MTAANALKPPFTYYGGKTKLAPKIAGLLPSHGHYVEPFAGSLAVLLAKRPSLMETVNDFDGDLMLFWRVLRDRPAEFIRVCALTPHSRAEWQVCQDLNVDDELERTRRVWVRLTQSRGRQVVSRTGWRHYINPAGSGASFPDYLDGYVKRMAAAAERLHQVTLECQPAAEMIERYGREPDVCLYVDPPYLGSARGGNAAYRHEMLTEDEHRDLAALLRRCHASVVLSGYPSPLYDEDLYPDWHRCTFLASTANGSKNRVEVIWSNRPLHVGQLDFGAWL